MKYYAGWSLFEMYNLPVGLRDYYVKMLLDTLKKEKEAAEEGKLGGKTQTLD